MDRIFFTSSHGIIPLSLLMQADRYFQVNINFIKSENENQYTTSEKWKGLQVLQVLDGVRQTDFVSSKYCMQVKS